MKKLIFILLPLMLIGCSSTEEKAKKAVRIYLKNSPDDYSRYEEVSWRNFNSYYSSLEESERYNFYKNYMNLYMEEINKWNAEDKLAVERGFYRAYEPQIEIYTMLYNKFKHRLDYYESKYSDGFNGWTIEYIAQRMDTSEFIKMDTMLFYVNKKFNDVELFFVK